MLFHLLCILLIIHRLICYQNFILHSIGFASKIVCLQIVLLSKNIFQNDVCPPICILLSIFCVQDTLRECPPDHATDVDYACNPSLQFISPMYFVSFVLTAQFVLINVVVAVLMKHLDDSNKEAQEEAEMDAEIELELAQGTLCCMGAPGCGSAGAQKGPVAAAAAAASAPGADGCRKDGAGGRTRTSAGAHAMPYNAADANRPLYSPAHEVSVFLRVRLRASV